MALRFLNSGYFAGKVGIGTDSPAYKLDVNSSAFVGARIESTAAGYAPASILLESGDSDSRGQGIYQYNSVSKNSWFSGVPYSTTSDDWVIAHKLETTAFNSNVAQMSNALFCVNDNGNVGIGTSSPGSKLTVAGGSVKVSDAVNNIIYYTGSGLGAYSNLGLNISNSVGNITLSNGSTDGDIIFKASNGTSYESMRVDGSTGQVGIGTTSPDATLEVSSSSQTGLISTRISNSFGSTTSDGAGASLEFFGWDAGVTAEIKSIRVGQSYSPSALTFETFGGNNTSSSNTLAERMRIDGYGNVGIGTTTPDVKLEVVEASPTNGIVADFVNSTNASGTTSAIKLSNADSDVCDVVLGANRVGANYGSDFFISPSDGVDGTNQERLRITENGVVKFNAYDSTNNTGTPTYLLGTDSSGNIVKTNTVPGSAAGPYLPLVGGTLTGPLIVDTAGGAEKMTFNNEYDTAPIADSFVGNTSKSYISFGVVAGSNDPGFIMHESSSAAAYANIGVLHLCPSDDNSTNDYISIHGTNDPDVLKLHTSGLIETVNLQLQIKSGSGNVYLNDSVDIASNLLVSGAATITSDLTVNGGDIQIDSALLSNQENTNIDSAAAEVVAQVAISYTAAFFDFVVKKGTNIRSGTVYACHDGTNVEFTETSTQDLGDTSDVVLSVDKTSTNLRLIATVASDDWSVKSLVKAI